MIFAMAAALAVIATMAGLGLILALAMAREDGARPLKSAPRQATWSHASRDGRSLGGRLPSDVRDAAAARSSPLISG